MGWWGRWGGLAALGAIFASSFLPYTLMPNKERLSVKQRPQPEAGHNIHCERHVSDWWNIYKRVYSELKLSDLEVELLKEGRFSNSVESPQGDFIAFGNISDDGSLDLRLLDRDEKRVVGLGKASPGTIKWQDAVLLQYDLKLDDSKIHRIVYNADSKIQIFSSKYSPLSPLTSFAVLGGLFVGAYVVSRYLRKNVQKRQSLGVTDTFDYVSRPVVKNIEECACGAAFVFFGGLLLANNYDHSTYTLANFTKFALPAYCLTYMGLAATIKSLDKHCKPPTLFNFIPFAYNTVRFALGSRDATVVNGIKRSSSKRNALLFDLYLSLVEQNHTKSLQLVDDISRLHDDYDFVSGYLFTPPMFFRNAFRSVLPKNPETHIDDALSPSRSQFERLVSWDYAISEATGVEKLELEICKAKYLSRLQVDCSFLSQRLPDFAKFIQYFGGMSDGSDLEKRMKEYSGSFWENLAFSLDSNNLTSLSDGFNQVMVFDEGTLLPRALVFKFGRNKDRLTCEYCISSVLSKINRPAVVPFPLYFGQSNGRPLLVLERVKGKNLDKLYTSRQISPDDISEVAEIVAEYDDRGQSALGLFKKAGVTLNNYDIAGRCLDSARLVCDIVEFHSLASDVLNGIPSNRFHHGDLHSGQLIIGEYGTTIIDPEWVGLGPPSRDLARLVATLPVPELKSAAIDQVCISNRLSPDSGTLYFERLLLVENLLLLRSYLGKGGMAPDPVKFQQGRTNLVDCLNNLSEMGWHKKDCLSTIDYFASRKLY